MKCGISSYTGGFYYTNSTSASQPLPPYNYSGAIYPTSSAPYVSQTCSYPGSWVQTDTYYDSNYLLNVDKETIVSALKKNELTTLSWVGDQAIKINRRLFNRIEKAIVASKDFGHLCSYIDNTKNVSVEHLTEHVLNAYLTSEISTKESLISVFLHKNIEKLNQTKVINFCIKTNNPKMLYFLSNLTISKTLAKRLSNVVVLDDNPGFIFSFAKNVNGANLRKLFFRLSELDSKVYMSKFLSEIKDPQIQKWSLLK